MQRQSVLSTAIQITVAEARTEAEVEVEVGAADILVERIDIVTVIVRVRDQTGTRSVSVIAVTAVIMIEIEAGLAREIEIGHCVNTPADRDLGQDQGMHPRGREGAAPVSAAVGVGVGIGIGIRAEVVAAGAVPHGGMAKVTSVAARDHAQPAVTAVGRIQVTVRVTATVGVNQRAAVVRTRKIVGSAARRRRNDVRESEIVNESERIRNERKRRNDQRRIRKTRRRRRRARSTRSTRKRNHQLNPMLFKAGEHMEY